MSIITFRRDYIEILLCVNESYYDLGIRFGMSDRQRIVSGKRAAGLSSERLLTAIFIPDAPPGLKANGSILDSVGGWKFL